MGGGEFFCVVGGFFWWWWVVDGIFRVVVGNDVYFLGGDGWW